MTLIRYTVANWPVGPFLVAATERGVCASAFGDGEDELVALLQRAFPRASLRRDDEGLCRWADAALAYVQGGAGALDVALDLQGTPFQLQVWAALREVARGSTCSYKMLAERIGRPVAVRAVARACASNPAAVFVPCHRVVRRDGDLGGYRWGVERKRVLLAWESDATPVRCA